MGLVISFSFRPIFRAPWWVWLSGLLPGPQTYAKLWHETSKRSRKGKDFTCLWGPGTSLPQHELPCPASDVAKYHEVETICAGADSVLLSRQRYTLHWRIGACQLAGIHTKTPLQLDLRIKKLPYACYATHISVDVKEYSLDAARFEVELCRKLTLFNSPPPSLIGRELSLQTSSYPSSLLGANKLNCLEPCLSIF